MPSRCLILSLALTSALAATSVGAQSFALRAGYAQVNPTSDNGRLAGAAASIDSDGSAVLGASLFLDDGIELTLDAGAANFQHTVRLAGLGNVVTLEHRPISLGANWHFLARGEDAGFSPYVGLGYNWTSLSNVRGINALAGARVDVADSDGLTAAVGLDVIASERVFVRGEARYINFDSEARLNGAAIGTAKVDPWVWSLQAGFRF